MASPRDVGTMHAFCSGIEGLPDIERTALRLRFVKGIADEKVVQILNCQVPEARQIVAPAMVRLLDNLKTAGVALLRGGSIEDFDTQNPPEADI